MEYDAYRGDLEAIEALPSTQVSSIKLEEAQRKHTGHKAVYDQLREDVSVKLRFLNENKVIFFLLSFSQFFFSSSFSENKVSLERMSQSSLGFSDENKVRFFFFIIILAIYIIIFD